MVPGMRMDRSAPSPARLWSFAAVLLVCLGVAAAPAESRLLLVSGIVLMLVLAGTVLLRRLTEEPAA